MDIEEGRFDWCLTQGKVRNVGYDVKVGDILNFCGYLLVQIYDWIETFCDVIVSGISTPH